MLSGTAKKKKKLAWLITVLIHQNDLDSVLWCGILLVPWCLIYQTGDINENIGHLTALTLGQM